MDTVPSKAKIGSGDRVCKSLMARVVTIKVTIKILKMGPKVPVPITLAVALTPLPLLGH